MTNKYLLLKSNINLCDLYSFFNYNQSKYKYFTETKQIDNLKNKKKN